MSTTTENFGIVLPEGSDTFNPLTFNNNAFTKVDEVLKANQDRGITSATHTYIDGINTILRAVATCNALIFVASVDYEAGSTIAVDGVTCTFRYADGTAPKSGAFKTNQAVLCFLNGTILTMVSAKGAPSAEEITYNDSNVKSELDSIKNLSTNEVAIGIDVNGDTIYRRTFMGSTPVSKLSAEFSSVVVNLNIVKSIKNSSGNYSIHSSGAAAYFNIIGQPTSSIANGLLTKSSWVEVTPAGNCQLIGFVKSTIITDNTFIMEYEVTIEYTKN